VIADPVVIVLVSILRLIERPMPLLDPMSCRDAFRRAEPRETRLSAADGEVILHRLHGVDDLATSQPVPLVLALHGSVEHGCALTDRHTDVRAGNCRRSCC
jgi:hypothetical protein